MKGVSKFLKHLFLFLLVVVAIDYSLGFLLETIYFNQKKGQFAQTTTAIERTTQDILIFGSSRATRHYWPKVLSDSLHMSCYNVGRDAQLIPYYTAVQEAIFTRYKPKLLILDINSWELSPGEGKYEKLSILLPYCRKHPELIHYIEQGSKEEGMKLLSRTYPYNSSLFILGYNSLFSYKLPSDDHGYLPLDGQMTSAMLKDYAERIKSDSSEMSRSIDNRALRYYTQFLENTAKFKIKTYVVISPKLLKEPVYFKVQKLIEVAAKFKNVKFINFSSDPKYNDHYEKFADVFHLNRQGSEEFSKDLIRYLK